MDELPDELPPSFTRLSFESEDGHFSSSSLHDPVSEVKDLYDEVEEGIVELRDSQNPERMNTGTDESMLPRELRQDIIALYSLSSALIETFAVEILLRELIDDEFRESQEARRIFERSLGVRDNLRLLHYTGIIDNGLHSDLQSVVNERHSYVHDPESSLYIRDYDEFLSEAKRCKRATKELSVVLDGEDYRTW
jgi:hypothetical protein